MSSVKKHYEYVVIGAGSGGLEVGIGLKKLGKDVLMVGEVVGGECTHSGCIPSKTFLSLAMHYVMKSQKQCNVELRQGIFDRIREKVQQIEAQERTDIRKSALPFVQGTARFVSERTIEVRELHGERHTHRVTFGTCIIATGSHPQTVSIEGLPAAKILTNDTLFALKELPERIVIFGGGPIGTEIGTAMAKFCTHTTIIVRSEMIPYEPRECVNEVKKSLTEEFNADIYENIKETKYEGKTGKLLLYDGSGTLVAKVAEADYYLMALGRIPNTERLDLENAGIAYEKDGIVVNDDLQTTNSQVYAIGDVTQSPKFTHLAMNHGKFILKQAIFPLAHRSPAPLPACTYSDPPIASVGEKEETDRIKRFIVDFSQSDRAKVEELRGLTGVVFVDMPTGHIKGASLVGHFAEHVINFFTLAITKKMSVFEFETFMVPYPTVFNGIESLYTQFLHEYSRNKQQYAGERFVGTLLRILPIISLAGLTLFFILGIV